MDTFKELPGSFSFVKSMEVGTNHDFESVQLFLEQSIADKCEGLMLKTLDHTYFPSKRSFEWLKLKKDFIDSTMGDSVDLCVIGADYGQGKRTGFFGSFLLACYDQENHTFQSVCKVGTGFSD